MAADVDAARLYIRPSAPVAVSWFEFLLDTTLLEKHLNQDNPVPSASDLVIQFLSNALVPKEREQRTFPPITVIPSEKSENSDSPEEIKDTVVDNKKIHALKLLALKVAAFLKWNLDILQTKIPLPMQDVLLSEFLRITLERDNFTDPKMHLSLDLNTVSDHALFALDLYHRWCVRTVMLDTFPVKPSKMASVQGPGQQDPRVGASSLFEPKMKLLQEQLSDSVEFLQNSLKLNRDLRVPVLQCFGVLTETSSEPHDWSKGVMVNKEEIQCQTSSDLGCFFFFKQQYVKAAEMLFRAQELHSKQISEPKLCVIDTTKLDGYCCACRGLLSSSPSSYLPTSIQINANMSRSLSEKVQAALQDNPHDLVQLFIEDNVIQEVPLSYREYVACSLIEKQMVPPGILDLHFQVWTCNVFRQILERKVISNSFVDALILQADTALPFFKEVLLSILNHKLCKPEYPSLLRNFIMYLYEIIKGAGYRSLATAFISQFSIKSLFDAKDVERILTEERKLDVLPSTVNSQIGLGRRDQGSVQLQIGELEWELLVTFDPDRIRYLLQQLYNLGCRRAPWIMVRRWELNVPLHPLVLDLSAGLLQDHTYILIAKSMELTRLKRYKESRRLLDVVERQVRDLNPRLSRFLNWEMLVPEMQLAYSHLTVPLNATNGGTMIGPDLIRRAQNCLLAYLQDKEALVMPEVGDECAMFLLNVREWDTLARLDLERGNRLQLDVILARTSIEICTNKGSFKASKEFWDQVVPIFYNAQSQQKRSGGGSVTLIQRENQAALMTRTAFNHFMERIKDITVFSVVISFLCKLHNILKDDVSILTMEHQEMWPSAVSNTSMYSIRSVQDSLSTILDNALKVFPVHVPWLKTKADLGYVLGQHGESLRHYLEAAMVSSDYFAQPIPKTTLDDAAYRRMVRSCSQLHCHTQAAVLCQFFSDVDYAAAFKALQEKTCQDSMDAYYDCIWDVVILEFLVYIHNKRGEIHRKQLVMKCLGQLELNFNSHEEIQRAASNVRKSSFLRSLVKQYL